MLNCKYTVNCPNEVNGSSFGSYVCMHVFIDQLVLFDMVSITPATFTFHVFPGPMWVNLGAQFTLTLFSFTLLLCIEPMSWLWHISVLADFARVPQWRF